jgi:hypothetical protein
MAVSSSRDEDQQLDPPLPAVCTAYATPPFLPFFHPTNRAGPALDQVAVSTWIGGIDFSAISVGMLLQLIVAEIHTRLERVYDSGEIEPRHQQRALWRWRAEIVFPLGDAAVELGVPDTTPREAAMSTTDEQRGQGF